MTYNFDPDRWLEAHRAAAEARRKRGEIDDEEYRAEHDGEPLVRRFERRPDSTGADGAVVVWVRPLEPQEPA